MTSYDGSIYGLYFDISASVKVFVSMITFLYANPSAVVITGNICSMRFPVHFLISRWHLDFSQKLILNEPIISYLFTAWHKVQKLAKTVNKFFHIFPVFYYHSLFSSSSSTSSAIYGDSFWARSHRCEMHFIVFLYIYTHSEFKACNMFQKSWIRVMFV